VLLLLVARQLTLQRCASTTQSDVTWAVTTNSSDDTNSTSSTMINYSAVLADNTTSVKQTYAFHAQPFDSQFSGLDFTVSAGAVKWSINLTSTATSDSPGLQFAFRVSTNATTTTSASSSVRVFRNTPRSSMTTYWVPSGFADVVVEVQVFDVALVDGQLVGINHSVVLASSSSNSSSLAYDLVLWFPPFARSLEYDPSIGLGTLVGSNGRDGGGTSSDNTAVIVGVAVAVPVAVAVVLAVIVAALAYGFYRKRKATSSFESSVNFGADHDDDADNNL
jgi:FlaG/FlaF family flagellin (archaellin)